MAPVMCYVFGPWFKTAISHVLCVSLGLLCRGVESCFGFGVLS